MINVTTLILKFQFPILDGDVPRSHPLESISLNSFVLLEHLAILIASLFAINC